VAGSGALFFVFSAPKTIFTIVASHLTTLEVHGAGRTHCSGGCFTTNPTLWSFAGNAEEKVCSALARGVIHPFGPSDCEQHGFHLNSWVREPSDVVVMRCNRI
jgi:hypothetical protein